MPDRVRCACALHTCIQLRMQCGGGISFAFKRRHVTTPRDLSHIIHDPPCWCTDFTVIFQIA